MIYIFMFHFLHGFPKPKPLTHIISGSQTTREVLQEYYTNLVRTHSQGTYIITGTQSSSSVSSTSASESDMDQDYEIISPSRPASPSTSIATTATTSTTATNTTSTTNTTSSSASSSSTSTSTATATNTNMDTSMNIMDTETDIGNTNTNPVTLTDTDADTNANANSLQARSMDLDVVGGNDDDNRSRSGDSSKEVFNVPQQPQEQTPLFQATAREEGLINPTTLSPHPHLPHQPLRSVQTPFVPSPPTVEQNMAFQAFQQQTYEVRSRREESRDMDIG